MSKSKYEIVVLVGSLRKESLNRRFAEALIRFAPADLSFRFLNINLPLFNQDEENTPTEAVARFRESVKAADGVVFVTPEYNRSISGVLKNAIDTGSRPYGQSVWAGKPAAVMGVSVGPFGTSMAQQHLRNVLAHLDMPTLGQPEMFLHANESLFGSDGGLGADVSGLAKGWMERYGAWVKRHA